MADTSNRGLGSDKMDDQTKHDIQSEGGQSSHNGGRTSDSGMKGGQATEQGGGQGDRASSGQFEEGSPEASEAGRMGGSNS